MIDPAFSPDSTVSNSEFRIPNLKLNLRLKLIESGPDILSKPWRGAGSATTKARRAADCRATSVCAGRATTIWAERGRLSRDRRIRRSGDNAAIRGHACRATGASRAAIGAAAWRAARRLTPGDSRRGDSRRATHAGRLTARRLTAARPAVGAVRQRDNRGSSGRRLSRHRCMRRPRDNHLGRTRAIVARPAYSPVRRQAPRCAATRVARPARRGGCRRGGRGTAGSFTFTFNFKFRIPNSEFETEIESNPARFPFEFAPPAGHRGPIRAAGRS
jgi:hypothetical protein